MGQMWWKSLQHDGHTLNTVWVNKDGSLYNPNGYPEELVRAACAAADARRHARMSKAATKAAATRAKRTEQKVYDLARRIIAGEQFGPSPTCELCGKGLDDPESTERGIGSDCWQGILRRITEMTTAAGTA